MIYFCKMYKILTIHYSGYKKFIMTKEDFVKSRFIVLFLSKMIFVISLIWKVTGFEFGVKEKGNYTLHIVFILVYFIIYQIANKCQKNSIDLEVGLTKVEIEKFVRIWQILAFGSIFVLYIIIAIIGN